MKKILENKWFILVSLLTIGLWSYFIYIIFNDFNKDNTITEKDIIDIKVYKDSIVLINEEENEKINSVRTLDTDSLYNLFKELCNE